MTASVNLAPLQRHLNEIQHDMSQISRDVDHVGHLVMEVTGDVRTTQEELAELRRQFTAYVEQAERTAAVQRAETKLGTLKADLEREYGHYKVVRRSSVGLLQAFDAGIVSEDVASQISEELMIQTPRYWLAPALVALAAWSRDDKAISTRAVTEAYNRSQAKTALFFALVLRREQRNPESVRWLRHYFASCDPRSLTREFAVILEAASQGQFGPDGTNLVRTQLGTWAKELRDNPDLVRAQIDKWHEELVVARKEMDPGEGSTLKRLTTPSSFALVKHQCEAATALEVCAEKYRAVMESEFSSPGTISSLLDDLLIQLVTEYDSEELPLRREVSYQEAIIDTNGDLGRARTKADQMIAVLDERTDAVTLQTNAAIQPENLGVSVRTQQVAIGVGRKDFRQAIFQYTMDYRRKHVDNVTLRLDASHQPLASDMQFVGFSTSTAEDENEMVNRLRAAWDQTCSSHIERVSFKNQQMFMPIAVAAVVTLFAFVLHPAFGLLAAVLTGGIAWYVIDQAKRKAGAEVMNTLAAKEQAFTISCQMLVDARAEFLDLEIFYENHDADESELRRVLDVWPTGRDTAQEGE